MKIGKTNLISQNVPLPNINELFLTNNNGEKIAKISLGKINKTARGQKLYSFGAISDVHVSKVDNEDDALRDLRIALQFFNQREDISFICVCGDLTTQGTAENLAQYKTYIETYSTNLPVYSIAGNHESYNGSWQPNGEETVKELMQIYTGYPLYYSFEYMDDVFIMLGICQDYADFGEGGLQWLYETLEANRNKRCFIFQHIRPDDSCGNAYGIYKNDIWEGPQSIVFENLLKHYRNAIFFHGHSHLKFNLQSKDNLANIDTKYGQYSIHIPSISVPRTGQIDGTGREELYAESEGYVVEVYENGIYLCGRDFVKQLDIPLASYWLETKKYFIEPNTFIDDSGLIIT